MTTKVVIRPIDNLQKVIYNCLVTAPLTRDNDRLLMLKIWAYQNPDLREGNFSFKSFSVDFLSGEYTDPKKISKARVKIQRLYPETRGKNYIERLQSK